jgi:hypothetical protein
VSADHPPSVVFERAVLDTSIFIAAESGRQLRYNLLPAEGVSTVSLSLNSMLAFLPPRTRLSDHNGSGF